MASVKSLRNTVVCVLTFEVIIIILYALFVKYHFQADPMTPDGQKDPSPSLDDYYPMFQDVHVMIFVGFGFLMTFLRKYGFGALGFTFLLSAIVMQWGVLCYGFFRLENDGKIHVDIVRLVTADVIAAAVLISFGAVLGKASPIQLFLMGIIETVIFAANEYLGDQVFHTRDAGGSMFIHAFGAYFGLTVSFVLSRGVVATNENNKLESSSYQSDITAMIGTLFLWLFWPSFNGALVTGDARHRAVINTYLSLCGSCITTFAISSLFNKSAKFEMVHIQNATLAGGVCIGTAADMMVQPYGALIIGSFAGVLSTIGYQYLQGFLLRTLRLHDTCGVNNLHGMPGVAAGLIGALMAGLADENTYGINLYRNFPARAPINDSKELMDLNAKLSQEYKIDSGLGRTAGQQAGYQLLALAVTMLVAIIGGLCTGELMKRLPQSEVPTAHQYDDSYFWGTEGDEEAPVKKEETPPPADNNVTALAATSDSTI